MSQDTHEPSAGRTWTKYAIFAGFAGIAAFFLLTEHRAHLFGALPWILVLGALFLCIFAHRHGPDDKVEKSGTRPAGPGTHIH